MLNLSSLNDLSAFAIPTLRKGYARMSACIRVEVVRIYCVRIRMIKNRS